MSIAVATKAIKDDHKNWSPNFQSAPSFDVKSFQDELNKIAGFTQANEPVLKLTWAGDASWYEVEDGYAIERPRYAFLSRQRETYGQRIPIRRWFIEENTDPQQLEAMGGKDGVIKAPEKGFYTPWLVIADHSKCVNCSDKKMCYGDYRAPNKGDLNYITEVTYKILADKHRPDPRHMVIPEMVTPYLPKEEDEYEVEAREEAENVEFVKDWIKVHGVSRTSNVKPQ